MAEHLATVEWRRNGARFLDNRYSRLHAWSFDGGSEVAASSSPHVVPAPMSDPAAVDPEEAFVASISSCHMLWFLSIAARRGFTVDSYRDAARGLVQKNAEGQLAITLVNLSPATAFSGEQVPGMIELEAMHHDAHASCFIANSVRCEIRCVPSFA